MKNENEASRETGNTTDIAILIKSPVSLHTSQVEVISFFKENTMPAIDESGKEHKKVAWCLFKGWEV